MPKLMIYGATGFTGRLASQHAKDLGLDAILAGRTEHAVAKLANELRFPYRSFSITDQQLSIALKDVNVLLNCAGPFHRTAKPLIEQCLRDGVHYLDIAAELGSYEIALDHDQEAKKANVMLLPGCGGSAAMMGCLAGHAVEAVNESIAQVDIALHIAGSVSRGTEVSASENLMDVTLHRSNGQLVSLAPENASQPRLFDFDDGKGPVPCAPVTLPDLMTLWKFTGAPNIRTYLHVTDGAFQSDDPHALPDGPSAEERDATPYHASVAVTARDGSVKQAVLHTANGYTFTSVASVEAAKKVLEGVVRPGYQTSVQVFGKGFFASVKGSVIKILD